MTVSRPVEHRIDRHAATRLDQQDHPRSRPLVFVLDDDLPTLDLLCSIAEDAGWRPRGFSRLRELRAALTRERPHLMILDDSVPDGSGGDLARELRQDPSTEQVPVLVCTAAHPMRRAEIGGWAPVVPKPFKLEQIEGFLHSIARRRDRFHRAAG
jgi:DNA-binding response OmpR family regulator